MGIELADEIVLGTKNSIDLLIKKDNKSLCFQIQQQKITLKEQL